MRITIGKKPDGNLWVQVKPTRREEVRVPIEEDVSPESLGPCLKEMVEQVRAQSDFLSTLNR